MARHTIEIEPDVLLVADIEIQGSPDPRSGLFNYADSVDALPRPIRDAVIGGAIAGHAAARKLDLLGYADEVNINGVTLPAALPVPAALHAAMHAAVLCAAGAPARVVREGATWTVQQGPA